MARFISITIVLMLLGAVQAVACTTIRFKSNHEILVGKSFDWEEGTGLIVANPIGVVKHDLRVLTLQSGQALSWRSRYASITFNLVAPGMPLGGMNERGLVVEEMSLPETLYDQGGRQTRKLPMVNLFQWAQYQLDTAANLDEAIANAKKIRIVSETHFLGLHYLICDGTGSCAAFEYLNGKLHIYRQAAVLANSTFANSERALRDYEADPSEKIKSYSLERFIRATLWEKQFQRLDFSDDEQSVDYAFSALEDVRDSDLTKWQIVYDISTRRIYFRTVSSLQSYDRGLGDAPRYAPVKESPLHWIDFNTVPKGCDTFDISSSMQTSGDITGKFRPINQTSFVHFMAESSHHRPEGLTMLYSWVYRFPIYFYQRILSGTRDISPKCSY